MNGQVSGFAPYKDVVFSDKGIACAEFVCFGTRKNNGKTIVWGSNRHKQALTAHTAHDPHAPALPPSSGILFPCCFPCSYPSVRRLSCPVVLSLSECLVFVCLCPSLHPCTPPLWSCFSPCSSPSESSCVLLSTCIVYVCISLFATPCCLPNKCCIHAGSTPPFGCHHRCVLGERGST